MATPSSGNVTSQATYYSTGSYNRSSTSIQADQIAIGLQSTIFEPEAYTRDATFLRSGLQLGLRVYFRDGGAGSTAGDRLRVVLTNTAGYFTACSYESGGTSSGGSSFDWYTDKLSSYTSSKIITTELTSFTTTQYYLILYNTTAMTLNTNTNNGDGTSGHVTFGTPTITVQLQIYSTETKSWEDAEASQTLSLGTNGNIYYYLPIKYSLTYSKGIATSGDAPVTQYITGNTSFTLGGTGTLAYSGSVSVSKNATLTINHYNDSTLFTTTSATKAIPGSYPETGVVSSWTINGTAYTTTGQCAGITGNSTATPGWTYSKYPSQITYVSQAVTANVSTSYPEKEGYTCAGWSQDGSTVITSITKTIQDDTSDNVYAVWSYQTYKLTINPQGGQFSDGSTSSVEETLTYNSSNWNNISSHTVTRTGYILQGYYSAQSGGVKIYDAAGACTNDGTYWSGGIYINNGPLSVYAQWEAIDVTATYSNVDIYGVELLEIPPDPVTVKYSEYIKIPNNGSLVKPQSSEIGPERSVTLQINYDDGTAATSSTGIITDDQVYSTYQFNNQWSDGTTSYATDSQLSLLTDTTFYSVWTVKETWSDKGNILVNVTLAAPKNKSNTITYNYNGGTGPRTSEIANYIFNGWVIDEQTYPLSYSELISENTTKSATASWTNPTITLPVPDSRTGYTFNYWEPSDKSWHKNAGESYTVTEDITLYANWTVSTYYVYYDGNGATSGTMPDYKIATYDTAFVTDVNTFVRKGYIFTGWVDSLGNSWTAVGDGTYKPPGGTYTYEQDITLTAQWLPKYKTSVKNSKGQWCMADNIYIKSATETWSSIKNIYVKIDGAWKKINNV